jgi:hypothetical protein
MFVDQLIKQDFPELILLRFNAPILYVLRIILFSGMTFNLVGVYKKFKGTYDLCLQGERVSCATHRQAKLSQKMEIVP